MQIDERELARFVGKAIASRRMAAGLTQEEVAEALKIGNEAVSRMERGTVMPTVGRLVALAEIFSCGVNDLLLEASPRPNRAGAEDCQSTYKLVSRRQGLCLKHAGTTFSPLVNSGHSLRLCCYHYW